MRKYINDKSQFAQSVDELDGHLLNFEGHDRPRYIYPANTEAGYLGLEGWAEYFNKPTYDSDGTGTLSAGAFTTTTPVVTGSGDGAITGPTESTLIVAEDWTLTCTVGGATGTFTVVGSISGAQADLTVGTPYSNDYFDITVADGANDWTVNDTITFTISITGDKFYSIIVVPYKNNIAPGGLPIYGEATSPSMPQQPTGTNKSLVFNIPKHPQKVIKFCGFADATETGRVTDSNLDTTEDFYVGYTLRNVETGEESTIYQNGESTLYAGLDFTAGDRYQILDSATQGRLIYAAEMAAETDVSTASYYLRATIANNSQDQYEMSAYAESADIWNFSAGFFPPPNANAVSVISGMAFAGGGIADETGKASYIGTTETKQATATTDEQIKAEIIDDDYTSAGTARVMRLTLGNNLTGFTNAKIGSYITVTDSEDSGNDVEDVRVTRVNDTDLVAQDEVTGGELIDVGDFSTAVTDVQISADLLPDTWLTNDWSMQIQMTMEKTGVLEYYWENRVDAYFSSISGYSNQYIRKTASDDIEIRMVWSDSGTTAGANGFSTVTISSADWDAGFHTLTIGWDAAGYTVELDGVAPTFSGSFDNTKWHYMRTDKPIEIADSNYAGEIQRYFYTSIDDSTLSHDLVFDVGTGSTVPDVVNNYDGTINNYIEAFWEEIQSFTNTGDGVISVGPTLTDRADEDLWELICTVAGPSATFSVEGSLAGAQVDLTSGAAYSNDYFSMTLTDGSTAWAVGDRLTFNVVKEAVTDIRWIEFVNNDGVANADDEAMKVVLTPNYIEGNASGTDQTTFAEGMVDAKFMFTDDNASPYVISWVDTANQRLGIASLYDGENDGTDAAIKVTSDYSLYYSDSRNPHRWRGENIIDIGDFIVGISSISDNVIVFCSNSVWRVPIDSLGTTPVLISDNVRCPAQFSISKGERYIAFYDGTGVSITDGVGVQSVTSYKAKDYLANINKGYEANIKSVYDPVLRRFEFVFPMGADTLNNYGLYITEGSWNCYPFSRPDCNALWTNYEDGNLFVYHGTTGSMVADVGMILKHEGATDGLPDGEAYILEITSISSQTVRVSTDEASSIGAGDTVTIYPVTSGGQYRQMIVETSTLISTGVYDLTFNVAYDLTSYTAGDLVLYGLIPFDYGVRWTDFGSPQYKHQPRALHLEIENAFGLIYVEHYKDMIGTVVQTDAYSLSPATTKMVIPFRGGKCYKYGFRIRGAMINRMKINSFEVMFDTQV